MKLLLAEFPHWLDVWFERKRDNKYYPGVFDLSTDGVVASGGGNGWEQVRSAIPAMFGLRRQSDIQVGDRRSNLLMSLEVHAADVNLK